METLRIPKHRVSAEVRLAGGAVRRVALFLAEAALDHAGPERPSDVLNDRHEFLPAFDEDAQTMTFLHRGAIALLRVPASAEATDPEDLTLPTEHEVEVHLADGAQLAGLVSYLRPPDRSRLLDFLNEPAPFFALIEGDQVALIGKRHVARVALVAR
ncbi:MAG: hypothetical protein QM767_03585 [Anaeromyxobacter sp.]